VRALQLRAATNPLPPSLPPSPADFALGIAKAFAYLHERSPPLIHRDLKSNNCLITEWREVKLCDFGMARALNDMEMTECVGTKYYMSPEMISGDRYTTKTDVYSFGSLLADIGMGGHLVSLYMNRMGGPRAIDFNSYIIKGWRPSLPRAWSEEMPIIVKMIEACWQPNPDDRPSFPKIKKILLNWSGKLSKKMRESPVTRATNECSDEEIECVRASERSERQKKDLLLLPVAAGQARRRCSAARPPPSLLPAHPSLAQVPAQGHHLHEGSGRQVRDR
jgi:serine/threonine protein kinase